MHGLAVKVGSVNLLPFCALTLVPTGLLGALAYHVAGEPLPTPEEAGGRRGHLGVRRLVGDRRLLCLAALIVTTQIVSTVLDLHLSRFVEIAIPLADERTRWFGGFYASLNGGAALFQFALAPLLLHTLRLRTIHVAIPAVHLVLCVCALFIPSLLIAAAALFAFKVLDYSLFRAAKELLYVPMSFDARYRAKELIDAFGYRVAKGGASGVLAAASHFGALPLALYPATAILALAGWAALTLPITRAPLSE